MTLQMMWKYKKVDNFKYLGAWIDDTANDVKVQESR